MKQKYQNTLGFIVLVILLSLLPLLLLAQDYSELGITKKVEAAVLYEICQANSKLSVGGSQVDNTFIKRWENHFHTNTDVCELKEVICNSNGLITALDLSNMELTKLPSSMQSLKHLERLYLHENELTELPSSLGNLDRLNELTIFQNDLDNLDPKLRALCGISVVNGLDGNPVSRYMTWEEFCRGI
ncbi:MAG: hypothetical protein AB8F74_02450 [Saprospiraceae bacterium]